jgi:hypothetical protein
MNRGRILATIALLAVGTVLSATKASAAPPAAVTLSFFKAALASENSPQVALTWATGSEINSAGFNIYRSENVDGPYVRINPQLIPTSFDPVTGGKYQHMDMNVVTGRTYYYQLEDVELNGTSKRHEPVVIAVSSTSPTFTLMTLVFGILVGVAAILGAGFMFRKRINVTQGLDPQVRS